MADLPIDLVFFTGCPHAEAARNRLAEALRSAGRPVHWREHDTSSASTSAEFRVYPSPTVLVAGVPVTGREEPLTGEGCRLGGAPTVAELLSALVERSS